MFLLPALHVIDLDIRAVLCMGAFALEFEVSIIEDKTGFFDISILKGLLVDYFLADLDRGGFGNDDRSSRVRLFSDNKEIVDLYVTGQLAWGLVRTSL